MFSYCGSNLVYNEIEYFIYLNLWLAGIFIGLLIYFILPNSCLLFISTVYFNHSFIELFITILSIIFLLFIISPALIILLDYDLILLPSYIIYTIGYQWAWNFNIYFWNTFSSYVDHYIIPITLDRSYNAFCYNRLSTWYLNTRTLINNTTLIIPLYSIIKILLLSFDVIHSIGFYSLGIKIDAIPARINIIQSFRPVLKGEYRGFCFELCGQGHASMLLTALCLIQLNLYHFIYWCII